MIVIRVISPARIAGQRDDVHQCMGAHLNQSVSSNDIFSYRIIVVRQTSTFVDADCIVRARLVPKKFGFYPSHRIFGRMHGALNVDEKKTNCTVG